MLPPHEPSLTHFFGVNTLEIFHLGPPLEEGPLPTLVYFALSGEESLNLDPFNQPARFFAEKGFRVVSFTLPFHGAGFSNQDAMARWAEEWRSGSRFFEEFLTQVVDNLHFLIAERICDPRHLFAAGLSRGGFAAAHLAHLEKRVRALVGFAPMTRLRALDEFGALERQGGDIAGLIPGLIDCRVRFYIGNRDMRVGTKECSDFIIALAEAGHQAGHRTPHAELRLFPSIGHKGHGTPPEIFRDGADWLAELVK